jgi:hypothetical protein
MSNTVNNYTETDLGNISLNPRGEYDSSVEYEYLDAVSYQGGSYFCLAELETTITGIAPDAGRNSEHWQMIAAPGDMTSEYTAAYNDVINKAAQVETSRAAVELAQQEIEAVQTDVQQLHSDTVQMAQQAENSKNSAANSAQSAEQSRKTVSESEQNINGQITGFDSRVSEAVEQSKEEINTTKQQAINTITNQQTTSVNTVKTEGEKIITRVGNDAKTVADDRATVEEATQTVLNNAQEVARNAQTVASNTENAAASAESAKTSAGNAAQSAKSVEDASKQIEQNKKDVDSLKEDLDNKITKFYASNQGEAHITDSDNGKIHDMVLYGKSEQNQYKGINLLPTSISYNEIIEASIPKGTHIFWATDGTPALGGNFKFYNEDKTQETWFGVDAGKTAMTSTIDIDVKYIEFLISKDQSVKICLGIGDDPVYEPYTGGQPSPSLDYPQEIKSVVNPTVKVTNEDGLKVQSVTLNNITLNAIPVSSGGNVTIDGQQYIADYVDVERGKVVRMCERKTLNTKNGKINEEYRLAFDIGDNAVENGSRECIFSIFKWESWVTCTVGSMLYVKNIKKSNNESYTAQELKELSLDFDVIYQLAEKQETDLTTEQTQALKELATYYPVTNITVNSEQLDGYTVFNYPISMKNGWDYVKKQLNDNREYIYNIDAQAQDMDIQSAEAYVNSEYAVALTELEV